MSNLGRRGQRYASLWIAIVLIAGLGSGCGEDSNLEPSGARAPATPGGQHDDGSDRAGNASSPPTTPIGSGPGSFGSSGSAGAGAPFPGGGMSAPGSSDGVGEGVGSGDADAGAIDPVPLEPGQLTAGEYSDLENWEFWRGLYSGDPCEDTANCERSGVAAVMSEHWGYDATQRVAVRVRSGNDPVVDAVVELRDEQQQAIWSARTDSAGRAELFASLFAQSTGEYSVLVQADGEQVEVTDLEPGASDLVEVDFPVAHAPPPSLDLMFMVDTTGSMGDELSYIQAELGHVIEQVRDEIGSQLAVRLSVNFYRDRGDEYVVRDFQFTTEIDQALEQLGEQAASGGGDTPEAVEEALDNAVNVHPWSEAATARLLFFVLDAPPHHDDPRLASLHASTQAAAAKGVRIIPLAASGVDKETEFLLRLLAISTGGTYTFLTDHSGIGNSHIEPTIGAYDVELLDDLLVRVIRERL